MKCLSLFFMIISTEGGKIAGIEIDTRTMLEVHVYQNKKFFNILVKLAEHMASKASFSFPKNVSVVKNLEICCDILKDKFAVYVKAAVFSKYFNSINTYETSINE